MYKYTNDMKRGSLSCIDSTRKKKLWFASFYMMTYLKIHPRDPQDALRNHKTNLWSTERSVTPY